MGESIMIGIGIISLLIYIASILVINMVLKRKMAESMMWSFLLILLLGGIFGGQSVVTLAQTGIKSAAKQEVVYASMAFVFMAFMMDKTGVIGRLVEILNSILGRLPGSVWHGVWFWIGKRFSSGINHNSLDEAERLEYRTGNNHCGWKCRTWYDLSAVIIDAAAFGNGSHSSRSDQQPVVCRAYVCRTCSIGIPTPDSILFCQEGWTKGTHWKKCGLW